MTLIQAIKEANRKPKNEYLNYYVCKWNNGYCINSSGFMQRHQNVKFVYTTKLISN